MKRCMNRMVLGAFLLSGLCTHAAEAAAPPKYIFLFIGDGMGVAQRQATELYIAARDGLPHAGNRLAMNTLPAHGFTTTYAHNRVITGSAAAGTAIASGVITDIGRLGLDAALQPVTTVAECARDKGMRVGIVSSVSIDHATPAAFYAKQPSRDLYHEIAHDLVASGFDYHSAVAVMTTAGGVGHEQYGGLYHLAEIGRNIMHALNETIPKQTQQP